MADPFDPIDRHVFETKTLVAEHPPHWNHRNKQAVYDISCPAGCTHEGQLTYTRWPAAPLPESIDAKEAVANVEPRPDVYDYAPLADTTEATGATDTIEWHVNFADPHLFVAYSSPLFAQDELQVAEHPALGSLKEALPAVGLSAITVDREGPTPVLIAGIERRCHVATEPDAAAGRPRGLYGNAFARADRDTIRRATTRIDPPTITNMIAMAAPRNQRGTYTNRQVERVLTTAHTAFHAAVLESARIHGAAPRVVVHTGFWGCGAFGGNRELMAILQILAAQPAGVDRLVFHTFDAPGIAVLEAAVHRIEEGLGRGAVEAEQMIEWLVAQGFSWGVSNRT